MELYYKSTRGGEGGVTASQAILKGLACDGGLFVPERIPAFPADWEEWRGLSYQELAYEVMKLYFTDFTKEELRDCIHKAYDDQFDAPEIAPIVEADGAFYLELFHGATIAFKDMALSILPHLMLVSAKKNQMTNTIIILAATSGDTGKAALAGFADVEGTGIVVFYPKDGVSRVQEKQMVTQQGENTCVVGIRGNFDDAQAGVKRIFGDQGLRQELLEKGFWLSSANSINIGRLVPQIVYYAHAYLTLLREGKLAPGEGINVAVPTGNFGNILAAYYAKVMGLPIRRLICASNENKALYDFFSTGEYDRNRDFVLTSSPSMDILISSNLERLLYRVSGEDAGTVRALMESLQSAGRYAITEGMREGLTDFVGGFASEKEIGEKIRNLYKRTGYVLDTHTAVAAAVYDRYVQASGDGAKTVIASTASPFKFARSVLGAIDPSLDGLSDDEQLDELARLAGLALPEAIMQLRTAPVLHSRVCGKEGMEQELKRFLGIGRGGQEDKP